MGIKAGNLPISTIDNTDYLMITEGEAPKRVTYTSVKNDIVGSETQTTTSQTVKGAINELDADLGDKTQLPTTDKTNVVNSIKEINTLLSEKANKNWLINDNFGIWQRATSKVFSTDSYDFVTDRWLQLENGGGGTLPTITASRKTLLPSEITGANFCYNLSFNGAGTSLGANTQGSISQKIENGVRHLAGQNKKITISFWARSTISNKRIAIAATKYYGSGGAPSSAESVIMPVITLSNTFQKYVVTIDLGDITGKVFGTNNDDFLRVWLYYAWGTNTVSSTTNENYGSGYIDIAQVKVESGDKATPFVPRLYGEELALCQRYFEVIPFSSAIATTAVGQVFRSMMYYKVSKRTTTPTLALSVGYVGGFSTPTIIENGTSAIQVQASSVSNNAASEFNGTVNSDAEIY